MRLSLRHVSQPDTRRPAPQLTTVHHLLRNISTLSRGLKSMEWPVKRLTFIDRTTGGAVMYEHRGVASQHIVRVEVADGEVEAVVPSMCVDV